MGCCTQLKKTLWKKEKLLKNFLSLLSMPGVGVKNDIVTKGWTLGEMVEETRGKLHLKERDANAFYESSEVKKMKYEELISRLRRENKRKRIELSKCISGDEKVIRTAFFHRREDLLSMQRFTANKSMDVMDQKVCEGGKRLNLLQSDRKKKEEQLTQLTDALENMKLNNLTDHDVLRDQEIRRIQNEMDKASIKVAASRNITRRYDAIMDSMQTQVRNYPAILDVLEEKVKESLKELSELTEMNEKAVKSNEEAKNELHTMEREMYQAKRSRDQKLNEMKKEVEKRKETADRTEKRQRVALISDTSDSRQAKLQIQKLEHQEKILTLEDAFETIKRATHVSDMDDIIYRLLNQDNTYKQLRILEKEKMQKRSKVTEELVKLRVEFAEMKFTSERQIQKGRKFVDEMAEFLRDEEKRCLDAMNKYQQNNKLLMNVQFGIATLFEKLKDVRLKPPFHNFAKGDAFEDLMQCSRKLDMLLNNLGLKSDQALSALQKVDTSKLHEYLETKLPPDNIRIRVDAVDQSDSDEYLFDHDQENDGFTSRDEIKRQGQEILNSKLKPKKKKARKRNN